MNHTPNTSETPVFEATGGLVVGFWSCSWPFASVALYCDCVQFKAPNGVSYTLPKSDMVDFTSMGLLPLPFTRGVRFQHRVSDYAEKFEFWTAARNELIAALEKHGFGQH